MKSPKCEEELDRLTRLLQAHAAVGEEKGFVEIIRNGADVNRLSQGDTALHIAAERGHMDIARILRKAGARADIPDENGWLPHELAADNGDVEAFRELRGWYKADQKRAMRKIGQSTSQIR